jgi:amino acid transporter
MSPSPETEAATSVEGLRARSLRLGHLIPIGLAYFSLAPAIYFNMGFMESDSRGPVMPLLFVVITIAVLPTAASFAIMNNRRPSAGSAFTWLWESTFPAVGLWTGWMLTSAYFLVCALYPPLFGEFFNSLISIAGVTPTFGTGLAGGVFCILFVGALTRRNVRFSARLIAVMMTFEAGFVAALAALIIVDKGSHGALSLAPFDPHAAHAGLAGMSLGGIFAFLSIAGVDSLAPLAEESGTPKRLVPLATIAITVIAGAYWVFTSYGFAVAVPYTTVAKYVSQGQITPVLPIAKTYASGARVLVPITGMTAVAASFGASILAGSRLLYALSRERLAPGPFNRISQHGTPWNAESAALVFTAAALFGIGYWQGQSVSGAGAWIGEAFVFFILIPYLGANLAVIAHHFKEGRSGWAWATTFLVPGCGIVIDGYILYKAFFATELSLPFTTGSSIVILSLVWAAAGVLWVAAKSARGRLRSVSLSRIEEAL